MFVFARKDMFSRHSVVEKNDKIRKAKQILWITTSNNKKLPMQSRKNNR